MARLRRDPTENDSSSGLPTKPAKSPTELDKASPPPTTRRRRAKYIVSDESDVDEPEIHSRLIPKEISKTQKRRTQVRLAPLSASQSCLNDISTADLTDKEQCLVPKNAARGLATQREKPLVRKTKKPAAFIALEPGGGVEDEDVENVEESICCSSASDPEDIWREELPSMKKFFHAPRRQVNCPGQLPPLDLSKQMKALAIFDDETEKKAIKTASRKQQEDYGAVTAFDDEDNPIFTKKNASKHSHDSSEPSRPGTSSDKENAAAIIRFSPPRNLNPIKSPRAVDRPSTPPPQSPSKSRLKSPSKPRTRIPTPPHRPSLDAFWTADAVNEWNDQYSPKKILKSPQKPLFQRSSSSTSPPASPSKLRSPSKAETALRKEFVARREDLARAFLAELDTVITQGRIGALASSTGGVQLVWSKTLTSTAGRANWRKETIKTRDPKSSQPSQVVASKEKHYATIELATKVIDDEDRLLNVLAHEFCHLANFMVSGVKDQPHGKSFKDWGAKATKAFGNRGVQVTTKHNYAIEYKYVWVCGGWDGCGTEFKRHSKSIDVSRHRCGVCKGDLLQVKPTPRGTGKGNKMPLEPGKKGGKPAITGYAAYVKLHFAGVKRGLPVGSTHKDVMQALSRKYQAEKAAGGISTPPVDEVLAGVVKDLKGVRLGGCDSPIELE